MRTLIVLILLAAFGWSAYWFVGANALESAIETGIEEARSQGIEVETAALDVTGFPNRFDTMVDSPVVSLPSGVEWSAPFLQVFALSYRPNQIIAALPETQTITGPFGTIEIANDRARASATVQASTDVPLDHANLVIDGLDVATPGGEITAKQVLAATRVPEGAEDGRVQRIGLTFDDVDLPEAFAASLGGAEAARIDGATLDAVLTLDRPIDRATYEGRPVRIRQIEVTRFEVDWAGMVLDAKGTLDVGADGIPTGSLTASLVNWQRAVEVAAATGLIPQDRAGQVRQAVGFLSGGENRIEVPLTFRDGQIYLGPVPLGPAPRF